MAELKPSPKSPLPWKKKLMQFHNTPGGRVLKRFAIVDVHGIVVMEQFMMSEDAEETVDYVVDKVNAPGVELVREIESVGAS